MFTATHAIAQLDAALLKAGEAIALRHRTAGSVVTTDTVQGFVRGYRPDQLVGNIRQGDGLIVLSPSGLTADPKQNDQVVIAGTLARNVEAVETIRMAGVVVRHNLQVRG